MMQLYSIHSSAVNGVNIEPFPVRPVCGCELSATPRMRHIMHTWNHIYMNCTYPSRSGRWSSLKTSNRTTWMYQKAAKCAASTKGELHRLCPVRYWSRFFPPVWVSSSQSKAQPATLGPIRKLLSTWNTVEECVINYRKDAVFRCSSRTAAVAVFIYWS